MRDMIDQEERMAWWHEAKFGMFVHYPGDYIIISKVGPAIRSALLLTTGESLQVEAISNARWKISGLPATLPVDLAPVIKIEFESAPYVLPFTDEKWLDGAYV